MNKFYEGSISEDVLESLSYIGDENARVREISINSVASKTAKIIYDSAIEFWDKIGNSYNVGIMITTLGCGMIVYLKNISYVKPHLIIFDSESKEGEKIRIVQHVLLAQLCENYKHNYMTIFSHNYLTKLLYKSLL